MELVNIPIVFAQSGDDWLPHHMMTDYMYGGYYGFLPMFLFWLFIIVVGVVLVKAIIHQGKDREKESKGNNALEILRERYAKGEIDKKEFNEKKKDLS